MDIISRIKVEAQGTDQAAREIRKLKEAYDQVSAAARNLSPSSVGGGDPFSKATQPNTGVMAGGQTNADVAERETRNRRYEEQAKDRERANQSYGSGFRPTFVNQGAQIAEAASSGRGGAAVGGALSGLAGLLGPGGMALATGGALAMTGQRWAENEWERMQSLFGTGTVQRLGRGYNEIEGVMAGYGRMGVPLDMVRQFFTAGGQSGISGTRAGTLGAANTMMEAARELGLDPSTSAQFLGTLTRGNVELSRFGGFSGYQNVGRMAGAFGRENLNDFLRTLTGSVNEALTRGVAMTADQVSERQYMLEAYGRFGGLSIQGAQALNQQAQQRGFGAAQLQRPEDVMAFSAMRDTGMSVTDTMLAMERSPDTVNARVYDYLKRSTGGDTDLLRLRLQRYLGGSMSQVDAFIRTQEGVATDTDEKREEDRLKYRLRGGESAMYGEEVRVTSVRQAQMLREVEKTMLRITTGLQEFLQTLVSGDVNRDVLSMRWEGYMPLNTTPADELNARQEQDRELRSRELDLYRRRAGIPLNENWSESVEEGDWGHLYGWTARAYLKRAQEEFSEGASTEERRDLQALLRMIESRFIEEQLPRVDTQQEMVDLLRGIRDALADEGYVQTDNLESP